MRTTLFLLGTILVVAGGGLLFATPHHEPRPTAAQPVPCSTCQEPQQASDSADEEEEDETLCRIYHVMTMGQSVCIWYLLPHPGCTMPTAEFNTCDAAFGPCDGMAPHCPARLTKTATKRVATALAADDLSEGAPKHAGKIKPSHGPHTDIKDEEVVQFTYKGDTIRAHLFHAECGPPKDKHANKHPTLKDGFVGRQVDVPYSEVETTIDNSDHVEEESDTVAKVKFKSDWYRVILERPSP